VFLAPLAPTVRLSVNLLGDSDGKPFGDPLLRAPLEARLSREEDRAARWVTVPLDEPFHVEGGRRYWLVLQSLEGEASWPAVAAAAGDVPLQASADAGLSWSAATDAHLPGALTALHRLRVTPAGFEMPISVDVGSGAATQHVSLRRFEPLGRVDLTLDTPELAGAFDAAVAAGRPVACPTGEHVANGDLDDWIGIGDELSSAGHVALQGSPPRLPPATPRAEPRGRCSSLSNWPAPPRVRRSTSTSAGWRPSRSCSRSTGGRSAPTSSAISTERG
jgi:hypothetical protein